MIIIDTYVRNGQISEFSVEGSESKERFAHANSLIHPKTFCHVPVRINLADRKAGRVGSDINFDQSVLGIRSTLRPTP